jgi:hypothetical protein
MSIAARALCIGIAFNATIASAMDVSDEGTYAVIHIDGHVTSKILRFYRAGESWRLVDQKPDGSWNDGPCEGCELTPAMPSEVNRFMGGAPPVGMSADCVSNSHLAFCRIVEGVGTDATQQYGFVALDRGRPQYLKLKRLDNPPIKH